MHVCNQLISGTFHPPSGVLFSFPSRYYSAIGLEKYLALDATFTYIHCPLPRTTTLVMVRSSHRLLTGVSPSKPGLSRPLKLGIKDRNTITTPHLYHVTMADSVWAVSFSLAATWEISVDFFSTWYSDASLPRVRSQLPL